MKRLPQLLFALIAMLGSVSVPAWAQNIHNGYIAIVNRSHLELIVTSHEPFGAVYEKITVAPGAVGYLNRCCYAAGSRYRIHVTYPLTANQKEGANYGTSHYITPGLCNTNGIPHGFDWLVFSPETIYGPYDSRGKRWSYETPQLVHEDKTCTR